MERNTAGLPPREPLTVSQVTALVKKAIESALPKSIQVLGQISNLKRHSSGHLYLTLKDSGSELACVMWRSAVEQVRFRPEDGLDVVASGTIEVFDRAGRYQLYIRKLEPRGVGALELTFRQLCDRLSKEGLFDRQRKRPLPRYPKRIAVVTSPTGAAIADILRSIQRRFPCVHVLVYPVRVQGPGAAAEIAAAIRALNDHAGSFGGIDAMIVGRGGGSMEDLWSFNEEIVARAIHSSTIPVVSAVGHETDVTIADWVADVRAATPTAAGECVVPVLDEVLTSVRALQGRLIRSVEGVYRLGRATMDSVLQRAVIRDPLAAVYRREQIVDEQMGRMHQKLARWIQDVRRRIDRCEPDLQRIAPHVALMRGSDQLHSATEAMQWRLAQRITELDRMLVRQTLRLARASPFQRCDVMRRRLHNVERLLPSCLGHRLSLLAGRVRGQEERLAALSFKSTLGRGYSIIRRKRDGQVVRSTRQLRDRERLTAQVAEGEFESEVVNLHQLELFE